MKNTKLIALLGAILAVVLCFASCGKTDEPTDPASPEASTAAEVTDEAKTAQLTVIIKDKEGKSIEIRLETKKATLAEALLEKGLVSGDNTETGLYIKTVNGIRADYNEDKAYWAILDRDGNMTSVGASSITVSDGDVYQLVYTPADA